MVSSRRTSPAKAGGRKAADHKAKDTSGWLTRHEASAMLSLSAQTLANYERRGLLHPEYSYRRDVHNIDRRVVVYDPHELSRLRPYRAYSRGTVAPRDPGEVAARAFEMFREGQSEEEVVVELRLDPDAVWSLHEKWLHMSKADLVISPNAKTEFEKLVGPFSDVTELVEKLQKRLELRPEAKEKLDGDPPRAPVPPARRWVAEILSTGTSEPDTGAAAPAAIEPSLEASGAGASSDATSGPDAPTTAASTHQESAGQEAVAKSACGAGALRSPREVLLDEWLRSLAADEGRLQQLAVLLKREELEMFAELERGIGIEVARNGSRSPREQLLDVLLVNLNEDSARLEQIGAMLTASELDMLARLKPDRPEGARAIDGVTSSQ